MSSGFTILETVNSGWKFGQKTESTPEGKKWMEGLKAGWTTLDVSKEADARQGLFLDRRVSRSRDTSRKVYSILLSGIAPRPVAFVSSVSLNGIENLAPFSWFNQVSSYPPVVSISITRSAALTRPKDTVANIRATKEFTLNIISEPWVVQANVCGVDAPENVSEWGFSGLTKAPSVSVKAPRVLESAFSMECELLEIIDIKHPETLVITTSLVLASVKHVHVRNDVIDERGAVDPGKMQLVSRMGGTLYAKVNYGYRIERHVWEKDGQRLLDSVKSVEAPPKGNL